MPAKIHKGELPGSFSFLKLESENTSISSIKMAEKDKELMIIKLYETQGIEGAASLTFAGRIKKAFAVDLNENPVEDCQDIKAEGMIVSIKVRPYSIQNIAVLCER
jgi:alpha-mannosidase